MTNISENEAAKRLSPILQPLVDCVTAAFANAKKVQGTLVGHHPATMANVMSSMFEDEARTRVMSMPGVAAISRGRGFLLGFKGVLVRFKKVDHEYRTRNYPTRGSLRFDQQLPIEGVPPHPRVTLGYRLNRLGTAVVDLALVFSMGQKVLWVHQLAGSAAVTQLPLVPLAAPVATPAVALQARKRVKVRRSEPNVKES